MWLVATDDFSDLILNAVALEFVIKLDELIFECMVPQTVKQDLANAKLWIPMKMSALTEDEQKAKATTDGLIRSWIWYIVIISGAYAYLIYGQMLPGIGVFPEYAYDLNCQDYWVQKQTPVCKAGA